MKQTLYTLFALILVLLVGTIASRIIAAPQPGKITEEGLTEGVGASPNEPPQKTRQELVLEQLAPYFDREDIIAETVYVYADHLGLALYERDAHVERPIASLTKLMTALTVLEEIGDEDPEISLSKSAISQPGDYGLLVDEVWSTRDLLKFMLITSCNDCAEALSEALSRMNNQKDTARHESVNSFMRQMNALATTIGINHSYFTNATGFDEGEISGPYGSAYDMAELALYGLEHYPGIFHVSAEDGVVFFSRDGNEYTAQNTNTILDKLPGLVMQKTGYTVIAGGNLILVTEPHPGERYAIVIMGSGFDERFDDALVVTKVIELVRTLIKG